MARAPPVHVSDGVLKEWFKRYFGTTPVNSAGHLELNFGDRIREHEATKTFDAAALRVWLRSTLKVDASERTCQTWRIREWSTAGRLLCIQDIEDSIGDRLRLPRYRDSFGGESVRALAESLEEGVSPVFLPDPLLLREWYVKYHPESGPIRIASAGELEELLGAELRLEYADLNCWALTTALSRRRKAVLLVMRVVRTWIQRYRPAAPTLKRPAGVLKRPAATVSKTESAKKRRGGAVPAAV